MATLSPFPRFRAFDANGNPLAGGKLYSYAAGTSTPLATYTDQGGGTPNAHPVVLDANGEANVWLGPAAYKLVLKTSGDVTQWTVDNVTGSSLAEAVLTSTVAGLPAAGTAGRVRRVSDGAAPGLYVDDGSAWNPASTQALVRSTLASLPAAGTAGRLRVLTDTTRTPVLDTGLQWRALTPAVNVLDFGATPWFDTFTAPSSAIQTANVAAIQAAVDYAMDSTYPGAAVYFPAGQYYINAAIQIHNNYTVNGRGISLCGDGAYCSMIRTANATAITMFQLDVYGPPTRISNLGFVGQFGGSFGSIGVNTSSIAPGSGLANGVFVDNCWFGALQAGLQLKGSTIFVSNCVAELCSVSNMTLDGCYIHVSSCEINSANSTQGMAINNTLSPGGQDGMVCLHDVGFYGTSTNCLVVGSGTEDITLSHCDFRGGQTGVLLNGTEESVKIAECRFRDNAQYGIWAAGTINKLLIQGNTFTNIGATLNGVAVVLSSTVTRAHVVHNQFESTRVSAIHNQGCHVCTIAGNHFLTYGTAGTAGDRYGILSAGTGTHVVEISANQFVHATQEGLGFVGGDIGTYFIHDNIQINGASLIATANMPAGTRLRNNIGFVTEVNGLATIVSGTTSITVNHTCSVTPTTSDISVVMVNTPTNDIGTFSIGSITATQFTISCRADPGASGANFAWHVRALTN